MRTMITGDPAQTAGETLSSRTRELLGLLTSATQRTRYTLLVLNVLSLLLFAGFWNEKFGGTAPRIAARFWNVQELNCVRDLADKAPEHVQAQLAGNDAVTPCQLLDKLAAHPTGTEKPKSSDIVRGYLTNWLRTRFLQTDQRELEDLRAMQLRDYESIRLPVLGLALSVVDATVMAGLALLIIYTWLKLGMDRERSVLAHLLYPLVARSTDPEAHQLWNDPRIRDPEGAERLVQQRIDEYREEGRSLREAIAGRFLMIYARPEGRRFELTIAAVLIALPAMLLFAANASDWYWDFGRLFPASGQTFAGELYSYVHDLDELVHRDLVSREVSQQLRDSREQVSNVLGHLIAKRVLTFILVVVLAIVCMRLWSSARRLTDFLTAMYDDEGDLKKIKAELDIPRRRPDPGPVAVGL